MLNLYIRRRELNTSELERKEEKKKGKGGREGKL